MASHSGGHSGGYSGGSHGFGPSTKAKEVAPPVVATSYTDFPSLKKGAVAASTSLPSKPAMNFKDVAKAAASKPAPTPACLSAPAKASHYYRDEWGYDEEEDVDLEITDEDGGLNTRRAGDKSNW